MSQVALVTGGARRIGREICLALASDGYSVVIHYHSSIDEAEKTRDDCISAGAPGAWLLQGDLSSPSVRASMLDHAVSLAGGVDLLVNSASAFEYDTAEIFKADSLLNHLQTNYLAAVELTMSLFACSSKLPRGEAARVVTLLDQKVFNLNTDYMTYTLAKLASHSAVRYLAQCCAPILRVNAIAPGCTLLSGDMTVSNFEQAHKVAALGKSSTAGEIAQAVLMLERVGSITGQTVVVDGGQHLVPRRRDVAFKED